MVDGKQTGKLPGHSPLETVYPQSSAMVVLRVLSVAIYWQCERCVVDGCMRTAGDFHVFINATCIDSRLASGTVSQWILSWRATTSRKPRSTAEPAFYKRVALQYCLHTHAQINWLLLHTFRDRSVMLSTKQNRDSNPARSKYLARFKNG